MVYLSNTLTALPDKTFYIIPEGVKTLGDRAICDCEGLESVTLPSTIKRIGTGFLSDCPNLKHVLFHLVLS